LKEANSKELNLNPIKKSYESKILFNNSTNQKNYKKDKYFKYNTIKKGFIK